MAPKKQKGRKNSKGQFYRKHLTIPQRNWIEGALENQVNIQIKELQLNFYNKFNRDIKKQTIYRIKKQVANRANLFSGSDRGQGRKKITTKSQDKIIIETINNNNRLSWSGIKQKLQSENGIDISIDTIRRRAADEGIVSYVPITKPLLNEEKAKKRLAYALRVKKELDAKKINIKNFVFTDETKIHIFETQAGGKVYVKCKSNERLHPQNVQGSVKFGGGGSTFWGCMSYSGVGELHHLKETMTGVIYSNEILKNALKDSLISMKLDVRDAIIIEDRDPKHSLTCKISKQTANEMNYKIVEDYPPSSPDCNPIEHLWSLLKTQVSKQQPKNEEELFKIANHEWAKFNNENYHVIKNLILTYQKRIEDIINNNGWYTRY